MTPTHPRPKIFVGVLPSSYDRMIGLEARALLAAFAEVDRNLQPRLLGDDELSERLRDVDAVIVGWPGQSNGLSRRNIEAATRLQIVGQLGQSVRAIDTQAVFERDITLVNGPGVFATGVAEYTVAMMLGARHNMLRHDRSMRVGTESWGVKDGGALGRELSGKTVGLVGLGWIGRRVAELLRPFNITLLVYDPYIDSERARSLGAQVVTLPELLHRSDVVSVHAGLTHETRRMIGGEQLALMKADGLLVNTARGGVVDYQALTHHLQTTPSFSAALDVFESEPLPAKSPLRSLENVVLSPHRSGHTEEAYKQIGIEIAEDFRRYFAGEAPRNALTAGQVARMS